MKLITFFKQNHLKLKNKIIVVAASGGPDSMALLNLLAELRSTEHFKLIAAHFDHQLRDDSGIEEKLLSHYCQKQKIKLINGKWDKKEHPSSGIEAAARKYRYQFLDDVVKKEHGTYLITAHHGDDLLENILLKLIRSGNPQEMNSLQAVSKRNGVLLLRPLLSFSKQQLLNYDLEHQLEFIKDKTNDQDDTMRNRLRHHIIPLLKQENPHVLGNGLRFNQNLNLLTQLANERLKEIGQPKRFLRLAYRINQEKLNNLTLAEKIAYWQHFIWQNWHERVNTNLGDYELTTYQHFYYLWPRKKIKTEPSQRIITDKSFTFLNYDFYLSKEKSSDILIGDFWSQAQFFYAGSLPIGSKFLLPDGRHVKAKKMFAKAGIPLALRSCCLTIFDQNLNPVWVEQTYQDRAWLKDAQHYFVYQLKNK